MLSQIEQRTQSLIQQCDLSPFYKREIETLKQCTGKAKKKQRQAIDRLIGQLFELSATARKRGNLTMATHHAHQATLLQTAMRRVFAHPTIDLLPWQPTCEEAYRGIV